MSRRNRRIGILLSLVLTAIGVGTALRLVAPTTVLQSVPQAPGNPYPPYARACRSLYEMFRDPEHLNKLDSNDFDSQTAPPLPSDELLDLCILELHDRFEVRR